MKLALILMGIIGLLTFYEGSWRNAVKWLLIVAAMVFILLGPFALSGLARD